MGSLFGVWGFLAVLWIIGMASSNIGQHATLSVLVAITFCIVGYSSWFIATVKKRESTSFSFFAFGIVALLSMWVSYYMSTNQTWFGTVLHTYIIR